MAVGLGRKSGGRRERCATRRPRLPQPRPSASASEALLVSHERRMAGLFFQPYDLPARLYGLPLLAFLRPAPANSAPAPIHRAPPHSAAAPRLLCVVIRQSLCLPRGSTSLPQLSPARPPASPRNQRPRSRAIRRHTESDSWSGRLKRSEVVHHSRACAAPPQLSTT